MTFLSQNYEESIYLTRLQSDEVGSGSSESRESAHVRTFHVDLAEHTGLLIWYTCWVHTFCIIRRKEMPAFSREKTKIIATTNGSTIKSVSVEELKEPVSCLTEHGLHTCLSSFRLTEPWSAVWVQLCFKKDGEKDEGWNKEGAIFIFSEMRTLRTKNPSPSWMFIKGFSTHNSL